MPAEFFAVLRSGEARMIPLRQEIQRQLTEQFEAEAARLRSDELTLIPLGADVFRPDEKEAWHIPGFELPPSLEEGVRSIMTLPPLLPSEVGELMIRSVGARLEGNGTRPLLAFQSVTRQQVISPSGFSIVLDRGTFRRLEEPGLQLGREVHVLHDERGLVFSSLYFARRVFDLADHYREATDADVESFMAETVVAVEDQDTFRAQADEWVRRRLAMIADADVLSTCAPLMIREKAADYGVDIQVRGQEGHEQILFPAEKRELKRIVKFLSEDMYRGPLTDTFYESNSKRRLTR